MEIGDTFYSTDRGEWRDWLSANFRSAEEIWFVFPTKDSGEESMLYNDAVEEALCFGWIDSISKTLDEKHQARRFTPRKKGSPYSRLNIERLIWLDSEGMIHPDVRSTVEDLITGKFVFPKDIISAIRKNRTAWANYQNFTEPYKRVRIAYIDAARDRPEEFEKRLNNFIGMTERNRIIPGYGGTEKYYKDNVPDH